MFSKRHYILFSRLIRQSDHDFDGLIESMIEEFKKDNERFDEDKFREAMER